MRTKFLLAILAIGFLSTPNPLYASPLLQITGGSGGRSPLANVAVLGLEEAVEVIQQAGTGTLYFPAGVYDVNGEAWSVTELSLNNIDRLTIRGDGPESVIRLNSTNGYEQVRPLTIFDCSDVLIRDLKFDGNRKKFQRRVEEQQNNVFVRGCEGLTITNIESVQARGDGINIGDVNNVIVQNNMIDSTDRNGLTLGQGFHSNIVIRNNTFGQNVDTQHIDFEHGTSTNIKITNNLFRRMVEDQYSKDQYSIVVNDSDNVQIRFNDILNPVLFRFARNLEFRGNTNVGQMTIDRACIGVNVTANDFFVTPLIRISNGNKAAIRVREVGGHFPTNINFRGNTIVANGVPKIFEVQDCEIFEATNNLIYSDKEVLHGFLLHAQNTDVYGSLSGNTVRGPINEQTIRETGGNQVILD